MNKVNRKSTGLTDSNGNSIHVGDMLKHINHPIQAWHGMVYEKEDGFYINPNGAEYLLTPERANKTEII